MRCRRAPRRGAALVEFALIALVLLFLVAATLDFGRAINGAQILQQAADVAARELARTPLPATVTFQQAVHDPAFNAEVRARVYDDSLLVIQLQPDQTVFEAVADGPIVNKLLAPLMIVDPVTRVARYPGAFLDADGIYKIPVAEGGPDVPVFEQIPDTSAPGAEPFPLNSPGELKGFAAVRINYPFQAAGLVAYRYRHQDGTPYDGLPPLDANDVVNEPVAAPPLGPDEVAGPYVGSGQDQFGKLFAHKQVVRPFRRLLSAQAIYRREVFSN